MIKFEAKLKQLKMKKQILLFCSIVHFFCVQAISINVPASGTLGSLIPDNKITELIVTGYIDARDVIFIFNELNNLQQLDLSGVKILEYNADGGAYSYPADVMPEYSFYNSYTSSGKPSLKSVVLPTSITAIGLRAFENCSGLTSIIIPAGVNTIGRSAFQNCTELKSLVIPNAVTNIGVRAFEYCTKLEKLTISSSISSIGEYAFSNCEELVSITALAVNPVDISKSKSVFENGNAKCILTVPAGSEKFYRIAAQWQDFVKIEEQK